MKTVAVIMAGGKGERFWPKSRVDLPKQFLSLTNDGKTMIQHTIDRMLPLIELEDVFIVTNKNYKGLVLEQLPGIPEENIILEPVSRNTAPCIGLAAVHIQNKYTDAVMIVLPSDHLIRYNELFIETLRDSIEVAKQNQNMVTIGITPSYPETGYGYIHFEGRKRELQGTAYEVVEFVEKPNLEKAKEYLETGKYLWNSGIFVWKVSTILNKFKELLPNTYKILLSIKQELKHMYTLNKSQTVELNHVMQNIQQQFIGIKAESIDYGIMEKTDNIFTLPGNFGWDDVGSWLALERVNRSNEQGNVIEGNVITINSQNMIVQGGKKLIATVGIEDLIIVDTEDALLICSKESTQDVKKVIENLKICNRREYL